MNRRAGPCCWLRRCSRTSPPTTGTAPPRITGIAVAVDTGNTGESTVNWFGDIRFAASAGAP